MRYNEAQLYLESNEPMTMIKNMTINGSTHTSTDNGSRMVSHVKFDHYICTMVPFFQISTFTISSSFVYISIDDISTPNSHPSRYLFKKHLHYKSNLHDYVHSFFIYFLVSPHQMANLNSRTKNPKPHQPPSFPPLYSTTRSVGKQMQLIEKFDITFLCYH